MIVFSAPSTMVYGLCRGGSGVPSISNAFASPRGMAWDGDSTVYIADAGVGAVFSIPVGRCHGGLPVMHVANFDDVFGLAIITGKALTRNEFQYTGNSLTIWDKFANAVRWVLSR